ncbi:MAG: 6-phosphofructokinase, partial [Clostridia bacterium]|nr:6-phosphofructokinase [Clostridia bacterium]
YIVKIFYKSVSFNIAIYKSSINLHKNLRVIEKYYIMLMKCSLHSNLLKGEVFMSANKFKEMLRKKVAVLYGGGQIPSANIVLGKLMEWLISMKCVVYGIHKSYMGLADEACYEKFTITKAQQIQKQIGTYLETCRNVDPSANEWFDRIIVLLSKFNIHKLFICGGDGSVRAATDFEKKCEEIGYDMRIMFIPCTIDGINGSLSIGRQSAIAESIRRVSSMIVNSFATWDAGLIGPRIPIIELQGRNRNDIIVNVMKRLIKEEDIGRYKISDINLICVPSGHMWSYVKLINSILKTDKLTAIIVAEGAKPIEQWWEAISGKGIGEKLFNLINLSRVKGKPIKKANLDVVGYLSQTNDLISKEESDEINLWTLAATIHATKCNSEVIIKKGTQIACIKLQDLRQLNPNSKEPEILSEEDLKLLKPYLP